MTEQKPPTKKNFLPIAHSVILVIALIAIGLQAKMIASTKNSITVTQKKLSDQGIQIQSSIDMLVAQKKQHQLIDEQLASIQNTLKKPRLTENQAYIRQLIEIADFTLHYFRNIDGAIDLLGIAEKKQAQLNYNHSQPLHNAIAKDIEQLKKISVQHNPSPTSALDQLSSHIQEIPTLIRNEKTVKDTEELNKKSNWEKIKNSIKSLVVIEKIPENETDIASPQIIQIKKQIIQANIEIMRLCLATGDVKNFQASLMKIRMLVKKMPLQQNKKTEIEESLEKTSKNIPINTDDVHLQSLDIALKGSI